MNELHKTSEEAFLWDICKEPEDNSIRLIFADWLQDRNKRVDKYHAEFIRTQIALADANFGPEYDWAWNDWERISGKGDFAEWLKEQNRVNIETARAAQYYKLKNAAHYLLMMYGNSWDYSFSHEREVGGLPVEGIESLYTRGFVFHITIGVASFLYASDNLFSELPITQVTLVGAIRETMWLGEEFSVEKRLLGPIWDYLRPERSLASLDVHFSNNLAAELSDACVAWGRQKVGLPELKRSI